MALSATCDLEGVIEPIRREEAGEIARLLTVIAGCEWQVLDREETERSGIEQYRPARYSDVCILMPRRTGLRTLEIALEDANIPYRLEGASLVLETQEVRDLLNCLRAIDDPADQVATIAALRSPAFACTDVELMEFYEAGGRFDYLSSGPGLQMARSPKLSRRSRSIMRRGCGARRCI